MPESRMDQLRNALHIGPNPGIACLGQFPLERPGIGLQVNPESR